MNLDISTLQNQKTFLTGPAGTGKTTRALAWLQSLLDGEAQAGSILILVPQRTLATPYYDVLQDAHSHKGELPAIMTMGGLARRMVELFWPQVAAMAGFQHPEKPPVFLTLETAQYYMARVLAPMLDKGFFETVTIERSRLYSQVIDNLNKAAVNGYDHTQIGARLKLAAPADPEQTRIFQDAQEAASRFRQYCLEHNLLDFSLQFEIFQQYLWTSGSLCRDYLMDTYQHLIYENLEEDTPAAHNIVRDWLPAFQSALLIFDQEAGYRRFLGASPQTGRALSELCDDVCTCTVSHITNPAIEKLGAQIGRVLHQTPLSDLAVPTAAEVTQVISYEIQRYYPEMLEWVAQRTAELVHDEAIEPREIVLLSPYLSDALRYSLSEKLSRKGIPVYSHRPSRSLREEPVVQALLTLAKLAHPHWRLHPGSYDIAYMLVQAIEGLDLVRAQLLSRICVRKQEGRPVLSSFTDIKPDVQERIGFAAGQHYETLRLWLQEQQSAAEEALDFFLSRLFGEVLSQPGFGFHSNMAAGETTANLIESVQKFRWIAAEGTFADESNLSREYLLMLQEGVIAAQYVRSWQFEEENAVLLAPAYTFLMRNRPVNYQFWLDVGSTAWHERLFQPLTHPVVFSQDWPQNRRWTDADEVAYTRAALYRLVLGLMRRCRNTIFLGLSDLNESGFETQGQLMWAFQRVLQKVADR